MVAVRFYLQQILFQPDADAYRLLGLASDAAPESVQRHYRWLQSWLHPDRRGDEWEALLATRVNWAWKHLRTDAARRSYAAGSETPPNQSDSFATHESLQADDLVAAMPEASRGTRSGRESRSVLPWAVARGCWLWH